MRTMPATGAKQNQARCSIRTERIGHRSTEPRYRACSFRPASMVGCARSIWTNSSASATGSGGVAMTNGFSEEKTAEILAE